MAASVANSEIPLLQRYDWLTHSQYCTIVDMLAKNRSNSERWDCVRLISALGEPLLELQPTELGEFRLAFGGDVANSMVCLARILPPPARRIRIVTALGSSAYSRWLRGRLREEGLELSEPRMDGEPGLYGLALDPAGSSDFAYWRSNSAARAFLSTTEPSELIALLGTPELLVVTGITLALCSSTMFESLCEWIRLHKRDCRVVFDCNFRKSLWKSETEARYRTRALEELASVVATGVDDEKNLWGIEKLDDTIRRLSAHGVEYLIRGGGQGCWVGARENLHHVPAESLSPVDTAGAGDAHLAGYIAARISGCRRSEAAKFANDVAAQIIKQRGSAPTVDTSFPELPISL